MNDFVNTILPTLQAHRLQGLALGDSFVYPNYSGYSILNIPSSISAALGIPGIGAGPLEGPIAEVFDNGGKPFRKVIFMLVDALGLGRFRQWIAEGQAPVWNTLLQSGSLTALTSVVPSTTTAALTTLWTGRSPAEHAIAGYELWLKEYGVVANMINQGPASFSSASGLLVNAGFQPETFVPFHTMGEHIVAHGIQSHAFQHISIAYSGLSRMFFKGVNIHPFSSYADLWINLRQLLESRAKEQMYVWLYWGEVDHLSHLYGPDDERPKAEFCNFSQAMESQFINTLSSAARQDTLLLLCADHGQKTTTVNPHYEVRNHPNLSRRLHLPLTGENRLAYYYPRSGQMEAVREYIDRAWPNQFALLDPAFAVEAGLFGPGKPHPNLLSRLGDLISIAYGDAYLWFNDRDNPLVGRHGGLSADEMLVPLLAVRL